MHTINILFWGNDPVRLANTNLAWFHLKKFCDYANQNGCELKPFLFDLSEEQNLDEAIHIPYPNNTYKRAEKINKVIEYHGEYDGLFSIMDSDLFINEKDYESLVYLIKKMKLNEFYVFKVNDLINTNGINFDSKEIEYSKLEFTERNFEPDLGGLFFMNNKILHEINGFDEETFILYGGEDNDASYRIQDLGYKKRVLPITPFHLNHENMFKTVLDTPQYKKQLQVVLKNKKHYK